MDLVVSLGGSVVSDAVAQDRIDRYRQVFETLADETGTLVVVTGAGDLKRYIDAAGAFDVSEARQDLIGIQATRLHASLLAAALDTHVRVPRDLESVADLAEVHDTIVLGGLLPGQSTDAVAAECAELLDADRLVLATTVDGVYDTDPDADDAAERYDHLDYAELLDLVVQKESGAGEYALVDLLAAKLIQRSALETVVMDGREPDVLVQAAADTPPGTLID